MSTMRAKVRVSSVADYGTQEVIVFNAVTTKPYGPEGENEDNTYARYTPSATFNISINNPALLGKYKVGQTYYVDFSPAD